jgi:hypothetical protein
MQERQRRADADRAARADAAEVIARWNERLAAARPAWFSPTLGAALITGHHWLEVYCPGCRSVRAVDLRQFDRHLDAPLESLIPALSCTWCGPNAPLANYAGSPSFRPSGDWTRQAGLALVRCAMWTRCKSTGARPEGVIRAGHSDRRSGGSGGWSAYHTRREGRAECA